MRLASLSTLSAALLFLAAPLVRAQSSYSNTHMTCLVNRERAAAGLQPLGIADTLVAASQAHSDDMARRNNMDHTGSDGSSPGDRCQRAGFNWSAVAENIAYGQSDEEDVMRVWMDSPGHRENILNPQYTMMGSAVSYSGSTPYYTQNFATDGGPATNVPECDGTAYPDATTPKQVSGGGGNNNNKSQGGNYGNNQNASYGGKQGSPRRRGSKRSRSKSYGQPQGFPTAGGDHLLSGNDDDWFAQQGFGKRPSGGRSGGSYGGRGNMFSGNGGFDNMFGQGFGQNFPGFGQRGFGGDGGGFGGFGGGFGGFY